MQPPLFFYSSSLKPHFFNSLTTDFNKSIASSNLSIVHKIYSLISPILAKAPQSCCKKLKFEYIKSLQNILIPDKNQ